MHLTFTKHHGLSQPQPFTDYVTKTRWANQTLQPCFPPFWSDYQFSMPWALAWQTPLYHLRAAKRLTSSSPAVHQRLSRRGKASRNMPRPGYGQDALQISLARLHVSSPCGALLCVGRPTDHPLGRSRPFGQHRGTPPTRTIGFYNLNNIPKSRHRDIYVQNSFPTFSLLVRLPRISRQLLAIQRVGARPQSPMPSGSQSRTYPGTPSTPHRLQLLGILHSNRRLVHCGGLRILL
jgi:hypothetical protein